MFDGFMCLLSDKDARVKLVELSQAPAKRLLHTGPGRTENRGPAGGGPIPRQKRREALPGSWLAEASLFSEGKWE